MDELTGIMKVSADWSRDELTSGVILWFIGYAYMLSAVGFMVFGITPLTKAIYVPLLIAGGILFIAGSGFCFTNLSRVKNLLNNYNQNTSKFVNSELERTESTIRTYENVALKIFPIIILLAILTCVFISTPIVRAICIVVIAFFLALVFIDSLALKRIKRYRDQLKLEAEKHKNW